jgi:hypothetical protein
LRAFFIFQNNIEDEAPSTISPRRETVQQLPCNAPRIFRRILK